MKKLWNCLYFFYSGILFVGFLEATPFQNTTSNSEPTCEEQKEIEKKAPMLAGYNASARIDVEGNFNAYLSGSFLYWQVAMEGLDLYVFADDTTGKGTHNYFDFDYRPAFKIGLGLNCNYDKWGFFAEYTWLHFSQKNHKTLSDVNDILLFPWISDRDNRDYTQVAAKWTFGLDRVDLNARRTFYNGEKLILCTSFGLRGGVLNQKFSGRGNRQFSDTIDTSNIKTDSWFIGPRLEMNSQWNIGKNFAVLGTAAFSLPFQQYKIHLLDQSVFVDAPTDTNGDIKESKYALSPDFEFGLGMNWGTYFDHHKWHFDLSVSYDFEIFFAENQLRHVLDSSFSLINEAPGSLFMNGLTIKMQFDF